MVCRRPPTRAHCRHGRLFRLWAALRCPQTGHCWNLAPRPPVHEAPGSGNFPASPALWGKNAARRELIRSMNRDFQLFLEPDVRNVGTTSGFAGSATYCPLLGGGAGGGRPFLENLETCLMTNLQFPSSLHRGKNTFISEKCGQLPRLSR